MSSNSRTINNTVYLLLLNSLFLELQDILMAWEHFAKRRESLAFDNRNVLTYESETYELSYHLNPN